MTLCRLRIFDLLEMVDADPIRCAVPDSDAHHLKALGLVFFEHVQMGIVLTPGGRELLSILRGAK